ncbi:MAG: helix-turn-helix domain-containing protein [Bacteroidales bacterium]|nr:helix-turn-helix domain-containing protein [Bacteroidales bacterium]
MRVVRTILTLCLWIGTLPLAAEPMVSDYTFTHLGLENGVAGPHIFDICQTPDGIVWWSTKNTVDRFNGSSVRNYRLDADAPYSHFSGRTIGLSRGMDGCLYAFDNKGCIFRYDACQDGFVPVADVQALMGGESVILNHIHVEEEAIWVALDRGTYCIRNGVISPLLDKRNTHFILAYRDTHLLCTESGLFTLDSPDAQVEFLYPGNAETAFYDADAQRLWLGSFSSGMFMLAYAGDSFKAVPVKNLPANPVRSIIARDAETLLVGVDGFGVYTVPARAAAPMASLLFDANEGEKGVLHGNGVYSLLLDQWGDIFIGTYSGGVDVARPSRGIAEVFRYTSSSQGLVHNNHINCVAHFPAWGTVVGTDGGVTLLRDGRTQIKGEDLVVLDVCEDGDALLLATFGKGVYRLDRSGKVSPYYSKAGGQLKDDYVYVFCRSADGHLWMGTLMGELVERTPDGFRYYPVQTVQDMLQLPDGRMAVGTAAGILTVTPGSTYVEELMLADADVDVNRYIMSLFLDGNRLWVASDGGGIYILDLESEESRQLTERDGLSGNSVCSIVKGRDGRFWVGTENGLCHVDPEGKISPVNHIWSLNREYTRNAASLLEDGRILLGSTDGLLVLHPEKVETGSYPAPLHLVGARFKARDEQERVSKMARLMSGQPELSLRYRDNTFELLFESVNLRYQRDIAYQYQMDGGEWSPLSAEGHFRFAEVKSGTHQLQVRSVSRASRAVLDTCSLRVKVAQPLWNTWWMWLLYILLITGAFVGAWAIYQLHNRYMRLILSSPSLQAAREPSAPEESRPVDGANQEFVDRCTRIVVAHMADSAFSIDDLCREVGTSRTYLYMRLKTFTGDSPQDFIRFIRMERAAVLLRDRQPVAQVSEAVGFDNPKYFSTVFKKYFGVSPSKYR